jgi:hypothetical protein
MSDTNQLKYKDLIKKQNINGDCPCKSCVDAKGTYFRWVIDPIEHSDNFIPGIIFSNRRNIPTRRNSEDDKLKCSGCAVSLFTSIELAEQKFRLIPRNLKSIYGYTHIARGSINKTGLMTPIKNGHLDLFEYEGTDLISSFTIVKNLTK